ncbi:MAG: dTDP-glucose pyrophosphorylase [Candidatus Brocadia sp. WS118]|nr:MAG: dTDP-glucose pyrophosphorylase [Candidatus Brocadia sp. WS118]
MHTLTRTKERHHEIIGLFPAGGQAKRIAPLPCSKELYPLGFRQVDEEGSFRPKVACHYLLEKMRIAGITKVYIILRIGKWDIPAYLGDGKMLDMQLAYLIMRIPFGVPYTLDQAYPFVQDAIVALGFPDIIFQTNDAFAQLLYRQMETNADVVLGLFATNQFQKWDMVEVEANGKIRQIVIKPLQTHLRYNWAIAVWTPVFTRFMHEHIDKILNTNGPENIKNNVSERRELSIGSVIQAAIINNLQVEGVIFPDNICLDIGTSEDLIKAVNNINKI